MEYITIKQLGERGKEGTTFLVISYPVDFENPIQFGLNRLNNDLPIPCVWPVIAYFI